MSNNDSRPSDPPDSKPQLSRQTSQAADQELARPKARARVLRFAGLGTELAAFTLAIAGIGYLLDSVRGHDRPYATALGTLIGFTLGMVRFIHTVTKVDD